MSYETHDDYEWQNEYPSYHAWQTRDIMSKGIQFEVPDDFVIEDNKLVENYNLGKEKFLLMNFMLEHKPESVFEVGFGYGNNLESIRKILPDTSINGCDISYKQYHGAISRYPKLTNCNLKVCDFVKEEITEKFDIVYSNAVVMHLSYDRTKQAIEKMCSIANKYAVFCDGKIRIENVEEYASQFGEVVMLHDFAEKYWTNYKVPPFYVKVSK